MAKPNGDTNTLRDKEVDIETKAAFAGMGDSGGSGDYSMPGTTTDTAAQMAQSAVDAVKSFNSGSDEGAASGTTSGEDWD